MKYLKKDYKFLRFEKSDRKTSKYQAILQNKKTGNLVKVHFGGIKKNGIPYEQYKDKTGLGLYSGYDHNDNERRDRYKKRHAKDISTFKNYWSAGYFADRFLWS